MGASPRTVAALVTSLLRRYPALRIAGAEPGRYRPAAPGEAGETAGRIMRSGARLVLVGLGCPRQEIFVHAMRPLLDVPLMAVGAAFDYHAGLQRPAPVWMQRRGLAWLWRLGRQPRRLWRRYLLGNPAYLLALSGQWLGLWRPCVSPRLPRHRRSEPVQL